MKKLKKLKKNDDIKEAIDDWEDKKFIKMLKKKDIYYETSNGFENYPELQERIAKNNKLAWKFKITKSFINKLNIDDDWDSGRMAEDVFFDWLVDNKLQNKTLDELAILWKLTQE